MRRLRGREVAGAGDVCRRAMSRRCLSVAFLRPTRLPLLMSQAAQDALFARGKVLDRVQQEVGEARLEMQRSGVGLDRKKT